MVFCGLWCFLGCGFVDGASDGGSWFARWFWVMVRRVGLPLLVCGWGGFALLLCLFDLVFCGGWGGLCLLVGLCVLW